MSHWPKKYTFHFLSYSTLRSPKNYETPLLGKYNLWNCHFLKKEALSYFYLF